MSKSPSHLIRFLLVSAIFAVGAGAFAERLYLVNGDSYPRWLTLGELGEVNMAKALELRETVCKDDPIEVLQKDGFVVLRCGMYWVMPQTQTFIASSVSLEE